MTLEPSSFWHEKWGDCIALLVLFTGVTLYVNAFHDLGQSLVMAGLVGLKLRTTPALNGNGAK